ncbi:hypothetical protein Psi02_76930 [Planotetraspora silvatica]|uniref:Class I SAM-dependent methyltransferase n=1 Tax=Planotetraspora silvatica TaxID=234614 RepID=A0A8J3UZG6_9ACTN|nr:hypothetical protein Psi02_76930 [Planotetraspora silvatica]
MITKLMEHYTKETSESTQLTRSPAARILDVGGGMGVHAQWPASDGYGVHLIDPVHA